MLFTRIRELLKNNEGIAAIEFAMITPVLCLLLFGTIEFSMIMYASGTMESATTNAARLGKTGYVAEGTTRVDQIRQMIADRSHGLLDPSHIQISYKTYESFDEIGQPEPYTDKNHNGVWNAGEPYDDMNHNGQWDSDMGLAGLGNAGDIVVYTVTYPWQLSTPIISRIIGDTNGQIQLHSSVIVKNEPYDVSG